MADNNTQPTDTASVKVQVETTAGTFTVLLYGDTPKHRDNFVKLAREGYYDGTLFHRVIKDFMVQAGDPDSKKAQPGQMLGSGGPGYTIEAEIVYPKHYHKRGALAAARTGDQVNPQRRSSGSQFYVVTGNKFTEGQLEQAASQSMLMPYYEQFMREHAGEIRRAQQLGDQVTMERLQANLNSYMAQKAAEVKLPDNIVKDYTTIGGTPQLDDQYTVFGEVISGMDVIDKIEGVSTDGNDRPLQDVKILKTTVLE